MNRGNSQCLLKAISRQSRTLNLSLTAYSTLLVRVQVIMSSAQDVVVVVQTTLDYQFNHVQLLLEALKAAGAGFSIQHVRSAKDGNKRLAHVGNLALQMVISNAWYHSDEERGPSHILNFWC
jgi:hypothetical protein